MLCMLKSTKSISLTEESEIPLLAWLALLMILLCIPLKGIDAHEVPNDVLIRSYFKADTETVNLLVRVPLEAMRDMNFPVKGPGYLQLNQMSELSIDAAEIWLGNFVDVYAGEQKIIDWSIEKTRVSLPSDRSFVSYQAAYKSFSLAPLSETTLLHHDQALLDVWITYPLTTDNTNFSIDLNFGGLGLNTTTVLAFVTPEGANRIFEFSGSPGLVELDPSWYHAFLRFIVSGIEHILGGFDHLLFVLCLILPCRQWRPLIAIITAFTLAHSVTLMASAFGLVPKSLWFPPLIEMLIALSILYMALENILKKDFHQRWSIAFGFGLIHGFGFSFALSESLQFAGNHLLTSLLSFNIGVEIGQIIMILLALPVLNYCFRSMASEKLGIIIISALVAHTAWHWLLERYMTLSAYQFNIPLLSSISWNEYLSIGVLMLFIILILYLLRRWFKTFLPKV
jgi:hypothetical protein